MILLARYQEDQMAAHSTCMVAASKESHEVKVSLAIFSYDRGTALTDLDSIHRTFYCRH